MPDDIIKIKAVAEQLQSGQIPADFFETSAEQVLEASARELTERDLAPFSDETPVWKVPTVVVIGAGIAGLTAAHELIERGFEVHVVEPAGEQRVEVGGVARNRLLKRNDNIVARYEETSFVPVTEATASDTVEPQSGLALYGEHGYRYFPAFYRNLDDTMKRITLYDERGNETRFTAANNLVGAPDLHLALPDDRPPLEIPRRRIRSLEELRSIISSRWGRIGALPADIRHLERRMIRYMTSSSGRRERQYQTMSWWEFLEGHRLTPALHDLMRHTPQALIAMDVHEVDARTHGNILVQLLLDHLRSGDQVDRTLNGPTSVALLEPWKTYLLRQGVSFHHGHLGRMEMGKNKRVVPVFQHVERGVVRPGFRSTEQFPAPLDTDSGAYFEALRCAGDALLADTGGKAIHLANAAVKAAMAATVRGGSSETAEKIANLVMAIALARADYFVLAVPYVQALNLTRALARGLVTRPDGGSIVPDTAIKLRALGRPFRSVLEMAHERDPATGDVIERFDEITVPRCYEPQDKPPWSFHRLFTGVQFFFRERQKIGNGHVYYTGSTWGLSSISQQQFWIKHLEPQDVRSSLSVDIGTCDVPSACPSSWYLPTPNRTPPGDVFLTHIDSLTVDGRLFDSSSKSALQPPELANLIRAALMKAQPRILTWEADYPNHVIDTITGYIGLSVARETWRQVNRGLDRGTRERSNAPLYYYIDYSLRRYWRESYQVLGALLGDRWSTPWTPGVQGLLEPPGPWYLINTPELAWTDRPGFYVDRPAHIAHNGAVRALPRPHEDQRYAINFSPDRARVLWYEIANEQWVFAGAYNKTYTRLETMEAANESAKHAVNAILDHWMDGRDDRQAPGLMFGGFCDVWDPERNELEDLELLRRLDELLLRDGLPHFMDLLELDTRLEAQAAPGPGATGRPVDLFLKLLDAANRTGDGKHRELTELLSGDKLSSLLELLRSLRG